MNSQNVARRASKVLFRIWVIYRRQLFPEILMIPTPPRPAGVAIAAMVSSWGSDIKLVLVRKVEL